MDNSIALAELFFNEIMTKKLSSGNRWTWEKFVKGPIDNDDTDDIMRIAGCWCYDNTVSKVKFYTNQDHPRWK